VKHHKSEQAEEHQESYNLTETADEEGRTSVERGIGKQMPANIAERLRVGKLFHGWPIAAQYTTAATPARENLPKHFTFF
jgi:hypothetical protein